MGATESKKPPKDWKRQCDNLQAVNRRLLDSCQCYQNEINQLKNTNSIYERQNNQRIKVLQTELEIKACLVENATLSIDELQHKIYELQQLNRDHVQKIKQKDNQIQQLKSNQEKHKEHMVALKKKLMESNAKLQSLKTTRETTVLNHLPTEDGSKSKKSKSKRKAKQKQKRETAEIKLNQKEKIEFSDDETSDQNFGMMFQCSVCNNDFALSKRIRFDPCAHGACNKCAAQLRDCHICYCPIDSKSKQFT